MNVINDFKCDKCGQPFKLEKHLRQHATRKTPCVVAPGLRDGEHKCIFCNRTYSTKYTLTRHITSCKMRNGGIQNLPAQIQANERIRILEEEREKEKEDQKKKDEEREREKEEQNKKYNELHAKLDELLARPAANVVNVNNGPVTNIVINNYNTPNIAHLYEFETFRKLFGRSGIDFHIEIILQLYFDPSHPENASVHLIDKETRHVLARVDGTWSTFNMSDIAEKLRELGYQFISDGSNLHRRSGIPERVNYIKDKMEVIIDIGKKRINSKSHDYDINLIEKRLFEEFAASSQHPAVIADRERRKREIAAAKASIGL